LSDAGSLPRQFLAAAALCSLLACGKPAPVRTPESPAALTDSYSDGTPDFLRLDSEADRTAFRRWFTFLAESQFYRPPGRVSREVTDCAALLRFAYREALREHTGEWAASLDLDLPPSGPPVSKYAYPRTPLGAALFRVRPGPFRVEDLRGGAFAQFADAQTLQRYNTRFLTRDVRLAKPGDLLFYRQLSQSQPFHGMIFLGTSTVEPGREQYVVYHTGPIRGEPGELRRPSLGQLFHHPEPRWRPAAGNGNFLGVYRWNILRTAD
jgi:uncharacterized protein YfaT (DUF1175 family)